MSKIYRVGDNTFTDQPWKYQKPSRRTVRSRARNIPQEKERVRQKYIKVREETEKRKITAAKKRQWHLKMAQKGDTDWSRLIKENEKILRNQERLEFAFELAGTLVSLGTAMASDLARVNKAADVKSFAKKQIEYAVTDKQRLERLIDLEQAKRTLRWTQEMALKKGLKQRGASIARQTAITGAKKIDKATGLNLFADSPLIDAASIIYNLTPWGSNPSTVAKKMIRRVFHVDVDKAKREHRKNIERMKDARLRTMTHHKTLAWLYQLEEDNCQNDLDLFLEIRYRDELRSLGG